MKTKMTETDGDTHHVLGLEGSILWKRLYYPKQFTDSVRTLPNTIHKNKFKMD